MLSIRIILILVTTITLSNCSGGGGSSGSDQRIDPPAAPVVSVDADIKQLIFSWDAVADATHYRLLENPDGHSGFTQSGDEIPISNLSTARSIVVHLQDWVNALYIVQACNNAGCTGSTEISATDLMLETIGYFKASNSRSGFEFGIGMSLSGDGQTLAIGARFESSSASGINGDQNDESLGGSGAVYIFRLDGTTWSQEAYIKASNPGNSSHFGSQVDLSWDGNRLAVSAPHDDSDVNGNPGDHAFFNSGAVYVFDRNGSVWVQQSYLKASNADWTDRFGRTIAMSSDGNTLAIAAPNEDSSSTGINGDENDNSLENSGAVYVLRFDGADWVQQAYVKASNSSAEDFFGGSLALSPDGNTLVVGTTRKDNWQGAAYVFRSEEGGWVQDAYIQPSIEHHRPRFGGKISLNADGTTMAIGSTGFENESGAVHLFRFDGMDWIEQAFITASNSSSYSFFGSSVALDSDGSILVVGSPYEWSGAVGVNGDQNDFSAPSSGAVYMFKLVSTEWIQTAYIKATNTDGGDESFEEIGDFFGSTLGLSGDGQTLVISAPYEDGGSTGIDGDDSNNESWRAGAVYIY